MKRFNPSDPSLDNGEQRVTKARKICYCDDNNFVSAVSLGL